MCTNIMTLKRFSSHKNAHLSSNFRHSTTISVTSLSCTDMETKLAALLSQSWNSNTHKTVLYTNSVAASRLQVTKGIHYTCTLLCYCTEEQRSISNLLGFLPPDAGRCVLSARELGLHTYPHKLMDFIL